GLRGEHRDIAIGKPRRPQSVQRLLRRSPVRIQPVDGLHRCNSPSECSGVAGGMSVDGTCSPALSSQIEMIGTAFANSTYNNVIAANVAAWMTSSTGSGR